MANTLRNRQRELAKDLILSALAEHVAERERVEFSIGELAKRAGVSARTIYNYFPTRQDLIEGLAELIDKDTEARGSQLLPTTLSALPEVIKLNFGVFAEMGGTSVALARMDTAETNTKPRRRRTEAFAAIVADAHPELTQDQIHAVGGLIRQIVGVKSWYTLTRELGLTTEQAGDIVAWGVTVMANALRAGNVPEVADKETPRRRPV